MKLLIALFFSIVLLGCKSVPIKELSPKEQVQSDELIFAMGAFHTLALNLTACQIENKAIANKYGAAARKANEYSRKIVNRLIAIHGKPHAEDLESASLKIGMQRVQARAQSKSHTQEYCDSKIGLVSLKTMPKTLRTTVIKYGINQ